MAAFIEVLRVLVFGIVGGFTEWLPTSSTGHMTLLDKIILLNVSTGFKDMLMVTIQLGAILVVIVLYFHKPNLFSPSKMEKQERMTARLWTKILVACIPAAVISLLIDDWMEIHLMNGYMVTVTLTIYGVLLIVIEWHNEGQKPVVGKVGNITYWLAFHIGLSQVLSLVSRVFRSGAAIPGAIPLGCSRGVATEFPFFLGIPVIFGTNLLKIMKFGLGNFKGIEVFYLLLGMVVALLISVYSTKSLPGYTRRNNFTAFGLHRAELRIVALIYFVVTRLMAE